MIDIDTLGDFVGANSYISFHYRTVLARLWNEALAAVNVRFATVFVIC